MTDMSNFGTQRTVVGIRRMLTDTFIHSGRRTGMVELIGASFIASEPHIFGAPNDDYIERELAWYASMSLSVHDIPGGPPKIWQQVASRDGRINSNYGHLFFSVDNGSQFINVVRELQRNQESRRAVAIYTRPSMHRDFNRRRMDDFVCTNAVQYVIRNDKVHAIVQMRSNDAVFGYRNDFAWQHHALWQVCDALNKLPGEIIWQAGSFHVYPRHHHLIERYIEEGVHDGRL